MLNNYICAVDIGSSKIAGIVAEIKRRRIAHFFAESAPSKGIKKGVIVDSIGLVDSINRLLKSLKLKSGINIKHIHVNISGSEIVAKHSQAVIPLAERGNKVIALSDIQKVNEQACMLAADLEEEIIHQIPLSYTIDSQSNILNPLGLYSHRLEVDLYLVCVKLSSIQSFTRAINQAGYDIKKIFFSGLATSEAVFNKEFQKGINIICDIGSDITELLIFKEGLLCDIAILSLGGDDITLELSDALKISSDLAEDTKRTYGKVVDFSQIEEDKEILIRKANTYQPLQQRTVCKLITSKTKLICQDIKDALAKKIDLNKVNNFAIVGKTILLEGFLEMLEDTLGISIKIGRIAEPDIASLVNIDNNLTGQKYLNYVTSLGMLCAALKPKQPQTPSSRQVDRRNPLFKIVDRFKEVYEEYF